jgi:hypothetical protein
MPKCQFNIPSSMLSDNSSGTGNNIKMVYHIHNLSVQVPNRDSYNFPFYHSPLLSTTVLVETKNFSIRRPTWISTKLFFNLERLRVLPPRTKPNMPHKINNARQEESRRDYRKPKCGRQHILRSRTLTRPRKKLHNDLRSLRSIVQ